MNPVSPILKFAAEARARATVLRGASESYVWRLAAVTVSVTVLVRSGVLERLLNRLRAKLRSAPVALKYFNLGGLGEPIRFALAIALGPEGFADVRYGSRDEFLADKPSLRFGRPMRMSFTWSRNASTCAAAAGSVGYRDASYVLPM